MSTSIGKQPTRDWRRPNPNKDTSEEVLAQLRLPFPVIPEQVNYIPREMCGDARHHMAGVGGAPYTGYYINYLGALLLVTNVYGYWFEVQYQNRRHVAIRLVRSGTNLPVDPLPGLSFSALIETGLPLSRVPSRAPSRAPSPTSERVVLYHDEPDYYDLVDCR
jgi:hypothetical protein